MKSIRIGTRASQLALWQAHFVRGEIARHYPQVPIEIVEIISQGDRTLDMPLHEAGGKGLFLKELESALLTGDIDIAVHSMKDVTIELPAGLVIPVMCPREDPRDALVSSHGSLEALPEGARIGTCSLRRQCQLRARYPHLLVENLRGNVNTRLARLDAGDFDGIILAAAGLLRLDMADRIRQSIAPEICLPAVGQGIVGIECRENDVETQQVIAPLNDDDASIRVRAERAANARLNGGCHAPVAVYSELHAGQLHIRGLVGEVDGSRLIQQEVRGDESLGESLGEQLADRLLESGASGILGRYAPAAS